MQISPAPSCSTCYSRLRVHRQGRRGGVAINREPAAGSRLSAVWREQKRQANAIIQVAAVISCLISIINTRHRHGRQIPASIPPSALSLLPLSVCPIEQWAQIILYAKRVVCCWCSLNPHAQWPGNFDSQCNILF